MGLIQNFDVVELTKSQQSKVVKAVNKVMTKYKPKIVSQAQTNHPYQNQTYRLTHTTNAVYINHLQTLTIYAPAQNPKNGYYYGKKVSEVYNENWLETAYNFYKEDIERDFIQEVTR
jgi:hypothetical protein